MAVAGLAVGFGSFVGRAQIVGAFARRPTEARAPRDGSTGTPFAEKDKKPAPPWNMP